MLPMLSFLVRLTGLEPARRETLDPKSNASTNSATGADAIDVSFSFAAAKLLLFIEITKFFGHYSLSVAWMMAPSGYVDVLPIGPVSKKQHFSREKCMS